MVYAQVEARVVAKYTLGVSCGICIVVAVCLLGSRVASRRTARDESSRARDDRFELFPGVVTTDAGAEMPSLFRTPPFGYY